MKPGSILCFVVLFVCVGLNAQENTFRLKVLAYQWTTTHKTVTFTWPGQANTSCDGTARISGYTDGTNISATGTGSSSCLTTYTPPSNQEIDIQKPVVFILAETETARMLLTCTRNVRWSQCHALTPGFFLARNSGGHFEVQGTSAKGKEEWVRFDIVQQNTIMAQEAPTSSVADRSVVGGGVVAEGASSGPATSTIEAPAGTSAGENMGFPSKWKSMTTGTTRTLRFENNYIYGEVIFPEAVAKAGAFALLELKKDGDEYVGKVNSKVVRSDGGASCSLQSPIELTLVTPERIEGHGQQPPSNAKLDWATCSFSAAPERLDFTWIPVK